MTKKESVIEDWLTANGNKEIELRVKREIEDYIWRSGVDKRVDSSVVEEEEFTG